MEKPHHISIVALLRRILILPFFAELFGEEARRFASRVSSHVIICTAVETELLVWALLKIFGWLLRLLPIRRSGRKQ